MTGSVYQKTALPAKLDLTKYNTREQLKAAPEASASNGKTKGAAEDSKQDCTDVMRKDLRDWLSKHEIHGPPPDAVTEQKAMWAWIRDFHQEYSDDWFSRNMPRLHEQFKPVYISEMKAMKAAAAKDAKPVADMLDLGAPQQSATASSASQQAGGMDLLGFSEPVPTPTPTPTPAALPTPAPEAAPAPAAYAADLSTSLLSLDMGGTTPAAMPNATAGGYSSGAPAPTSAGSDLLGGLSFGEPVPAAQPSLVMPQASSQTAAGSCDLGLIDFGAPVNPAPMAPPVPQPSVSLGPTPDMASMAGLTVPAAAPPAVTPAALDSLLAPAAGVMSAPVPKEASKPSGELNLLDLVDLS
jgi:hypothetical protein